MTDDGCTTPAARHVNGRAVELGVEGAFAVYAAGRQLEAQGRSVIHLEIGEPDFPTPAHIVEAGVRALRDGLTTYTQSAGIPELREAIAAASTARGVAATPDNVLVTPGSKQMLFLTLQALLEPGDEVLVPDPAYPAYHSSTGFAGGRPVSYSVDPARPDGVDIAEIAGKVTPRTRVLVINSPHNPTGHVLPATVVESLAELALRHEIYYHLTFGSAKPVSIASLPGMRDRTIVVDGFSKAYAMTGWRLGYGIMPETLADYVAKLINNSNACVTTFVQVAGVAALRGPQESVVAMRDEYHARRDVIVSALNAIPGITCAVPGGAFYAFPDITALGVTAEALASRLLYDHGIGCLPGTAFGANGAGHLRFSYVRSREQIASALARVSAAVQPSARHPAAVV
jgi:aspartate/methionine/tyrosine aminotransferase